MKNQLSKAIETVTLSGAISGTGISVEDANNGGINLTVRLQNGPILEAGANGMQITDLLGIISETYRELNASYPCRENSITITKIEEAIHWQEARTKNRINRGVEGLNKE